MTHCRSTINTYMCYKQIPGNTHYCVQYKLYTKGDDDSFIEQYLFQKLLMFFNFIYIYIIFQ